MRNPLVPPLLAFISGIFISRTVDFKTHELILPLTACLLLALFALHRSKEQDLVEAESPDLSLSRPFRLAPILIDHYRTEIAPYCASTL
ncbi:MAG TPA: hypothetical protein VKG25_24395 [Bryobacteraceae bacterium]|nr:hypothetical protein [Bryobacteraceae bacterium]